MVACRRPQLKTPCFRYCAPYLFAVPLHPEIKHKQLWDYSRNYSLTAPVPRARKVNVHLLGHQVFVCQGSAEKLPYEDGKFDLVTAVETVYFWPNLPGCLQEVSRVLKQGGKFAILLEVVDGDSMWTNVVEGMKVYSPVELQAMLLEAGFIETEIHHKRPSYATIIGVKP